MSEGVRFTFDGKPVQTLGGQSLAAALTEAGYRSFRETKNGDHRGMFCGIGVCQDCLVEVDGKPNQRACMMKAGPDMAVRTQPALPKLSGSSSKEQVQKVPTQLTPDVLVIGGGTGGLNAAIAAAGQGAEVLILDERRVAGGQYYKQVSEDGPHRSLDVQQDEGASLVAAARDAGVVTLQGIEVWGAFDGPVFHAHRDGEPFVFRPKTVVVATGAYERPRFVPGWQLPGVMTTGAAQTLWRSYRTLPGARVAIVGNGPLNFQVALELLKGGSEIAQVAEAAAAPWSQPIAGARMLTADRKLTFAGLATIAGLKRYRVPLAFNTVVKHIDRAKDKLVLSTENSRGEMQQTTVDAICMNYGFSPQNEVLRLLKCTFSHDAARNQLVPHRNAHFQTSVPGVFAVGDCCGMSGAPAAGVEGRVAGSAAAASALSLPLPSDSTAGAELAGYRRFQNALWTLFAAPLQTLEDVAEETLVCRCEEVRKSDLSESVADHTVGIGTVKRMTRLGMGRCQGRYCAHLLAPHLARVQGRELDERSYFAPRVPVKPVPISAIVAAEGTADEGR